MAGFLNVCNTKTHLGHHLESLFRSVSWTPMNSKTYFVEIVSYIQREEFFKVCYCGGTSSYVLMIVAFKLRNLLTGYSSTLGETICHHFHVLLHALAHFTKEMKTMQHLMKLV